MIFSRLALVAIALCLLPAATSAQDPSFSGLQSRPAPPLWQFSPSVGLAYDSFGQRYELADEDTLDLIDEFSGRVITTLQRSGATRIKLKNALAVGQEATRNDLYFSVRRAFDDWDLRFTEDMRLKAYRSNSEYTFSSDYITNTGQLALTRRFGEQWRLRIDDRIEFAHVGERTRYNYDYVRNDVTAELERLYGIFSSLRTSYRFGQRIVPDSTDIDYQRHVVSSTWSHEFGLHSLDFEHLVERRHYDNPRVRSAYIDYQGALRFTTVLTSKLRLRPEYRGSVLHYDTPDSIYASNTDQSVEMIVETDIGRRSTLGIGPRAEFKRTDSTFDRAYNQWGAKGTISYFAGAGFWVQFTNELGFRSHFAGSDVFYSDYFFNWSTLYLSYQFVRNTTFDLFFSLNPETHEDARNNTTTLLVSTSLSLALD